MTKDYRTYIGNLSYDIASGKLFCFLIKHGLRENHTLLDVGCGSLRVGRLLIVYLGKEKYFGIDPNKWLIEDAIKYETGQDLIDIKRPKFCFCEDFDFSTFGQSSFDFIFAHSVLTHASLQQVDKCIQNASDVMDSSSKFLATVLLGDTDNRNLEWTYPQIVPYTQKTIERIASKYGLTCKVLEDKHWGPQTWILFTKA